MHLLLLTESMKCFWATVFEGMLSYYLVICTNFDRNSRKKATSIVENHCHPVKWELDMQRYYYLLHLVLVVVLSSLICGLLTVISCSVCQGFCWSMNERGKNSYQCSLGGFIQYT